MTTINLQQNQQREKMLSGAGKLSSSLIFFLSICFILVILFLGLRLSAIMIEKKDAKLKNEIILASSALNENKSVDALLDLQMRTKEIKNNLNEKIEVNDLLDRLSKNTIPGIFFSHYNNSEKKILITLKSSSFDTISKQVYNFKQSDFVTDVNVSRLTRNESGIECAVEMKVN